MKKNDIEKIYNKVWDQLNEDREEITELYNHLKDYILEVPDRYAMSGDTLGKYAELMVKQTSQIIELVKLAQKEGGDKESGLSSEDLDLISKEIEN